ncbi:hypothetical protein [Azospirillum doebereinerae]|uniref:Uncharacterized protein n=1 Tax=Azospirillum doebereinerae TaxID=92933 RepID=A0A433JC30_9PROT|nr:hypothetical protein [Azospirillum doebereinerae]MCG5239603.1 hypothetical protein [Azospirillum doebereinerae]RUQ74158.1 hypothetical protein EJ913_07305 [Azospirillum doebereinerae]
MPRIRTFDALKTLLGPVGTGRSEERHRVFCWSASSGVWDPATFLCWQCVQQYQAAPSKRKAIFIYDTFLTAKSGTADEFSAASDVLGTINLGGSGDGVANPAKALKDDIANIKKVKTWWGKINNTGLVDRYKNPTADFLDGLERMLSLSITDLLKPESGYNSDNTYRYDGKFSKNIASSRKSLTDASFSPDAAGLWGG